LISLDSGIGRRGFRGVGRIVSLRIVNRQGRIDVYARVSSAKAPI
jgi:hypothetical protein